MEALLETPRNNAPSAFSVDCIDSRSPVTLNKGLAALMLNSAIKDSIDLPSPTSCSEQSQS